jgi:hypothetical protein
LICCELVCRVIAIIVLGAIIVSNNAQVRQFSTLLVSAFSIDVALIFVFNKKRGQTFDHSLSKMTEGFESLFLVRD